MPKTTQPDRAAYQNLGFHAGCSLHEIGIKMGFTLSATKLLHFKVWGMFEAISEGSLAEKSSS